MKWDAIREALAGRDPEPIRHCTQRAAVAILLRDGSSGVEVLFIHRAEHPLDPWSGHMAFPGGRSEEGEEPFMTVVREAAEEVGVDLREAELIGALDELQAVRRVPIDLAVAPFVFRVPPTVELRPGVEVRSCFWLGLDDLLSDRYAATFDYSEGASVLRFPCFRYEDKVIWGLTYRMFGDLAARLRATRGRPS
jgi:8-oxo-dGTP pyrophosphatase MutT (NUDIX family)